MKQTTNKILFAYWNEVRAGRIAPRRFEIEPARIGGILPETFILERIDDKTFRYRLAGTRIFEAFGAEFRGENFLGHWQAADRQLLERRFRTMTTQGGIVVLDFRAKSHAGNHVTFECLLLPLIHADRAIDRFVGAISAIDPPPWLGNERLGERTLLDQRVIWPDGRPHATVQPVARAPALPHVRGARLVRSDRRQFRVYDGGLSKTDRDDT